MTPSQASVTVIVPAYNHAKYIEQTLESVAKQRYDSLELIVIDDASSDDTVKVAEEWMSQNPGVPSTLIERQINGGICAALNEAVSMATGDILVTLASDDWLAADHVTKCVQAFRDHPGAVVVYSDLICVSDRGVVIHESYFRTIGVWPPPQGLIYADLLQRNFISAPGAAIRSEAIRMVGGYDEELFIEDYDMWLKLARLGEFWWTGYSTVFYRYTPDSLSRSNSFARALQMVYIYDKQVAIAERTLSRLAMRRKADHVKGLYSYARTAHEKRVARRALRRGALEHPSLSMSVFLVAAHVGMSYDSLMAIRSRMPSLNFVVRHSSRNERIPE